MKKLLLTAFEPFAGKTINSSLEVAKGAGINNLHIYYMFINIFIMPHLEQFHQEQEALISSKYQESELNF